MRDALGRRMKRDYEDPFRAFLPRRAFTILRVDGRAFHSFTRELERPYSRELADALDESALRLCREMIGCRFAFGQSDEYSFLLTDFDPPDAPLWFEGNVQKMVSVASSVFTASFARAYPSPRLAAFDARVMVMARRSEVENYFIWRQLDASANSLNMLAAAHYPHAELLGKSESEKHDLLHALGVNWAAQPADFKRGRVARNLGAWEIDRNVPIFQRERSYLDALIPSMPE